MTNEITCKDQQILIIPDIHNKHSIAESIIKFEKPDQIVFLGDYFDDYNESAKDADNTALWLENSLNEENRKHLIGNHDLNYLTDNRSVKCQGYTDDKYEIVKRHHIQCNKLQMFVWLDDWLCTHAGLTESFYKTYSKGKSVRSFIEESILDFRDLEEIKAQHRFLSIGLSRGGNEPYGGILWCDYSEFRDIENIKQIFGHTPNRKVRHKIYHKKKAEHICLDTGLRNYAVYENGIMTIKDTLKIPDTFVQ